MMHKIKQIFKDTLKLLNSLHKKTVDEDHVLTGVCGGIGSSLGIPSWILRLIFLVLVFYYGTGILAYIILAIVLPESAEPNISGEPNK